MRNLAVLSMVLILLGCDSVESNEGVVDYGQTIIEENTWFRYLPLTRSPSSLSYFALQINSENWSVEVSNLRVGGRVSWDKNTIVFHNTTGDVANDCNLNGKYFYEFEFDEDGTIVLSLLWVEDPCPRVDYLDGLWRQVDTND